MIVRRKQYDAMQSFPRLFHTLSTANCERNVPTNGDFTGLENWRAIPLKQICFVEPQNVLGIECQEFLTTHCIITTINYTTAACACAYCGIALCALPKICCRSSMPDRKVSLSYPQRHLVDVPVLRSPPTTLDDDKAEVVAHRVTIALLDVAVCEDRHLVAEKLKAHLKSLTKPGATGFTNVKFLRCEIGSTYKGLDDYLALLHDADYGSSKLREGDVAAFLTAFWLGKVTKSEEHVYLEGRSLNFKAITDILNAGAKYIERPKSRLARFEAEEKHTGKIMGDVNEPPKVLVQTDGILEMDAATRAFHRAKIKQHLEKSKKGLYSDRSPEEALELIDSRIKALEM